MGLQMQMTGNTNSKTGRVQAGQGSHSQIENLSSSCGFASVHMPNEHNIHVFPASEAAFGDFNLMQMTHIGMSYE